jgi:hypothetical protein
MDIKTARIRALNDGLRQNFADGIAVMTPGIAALGPEAVVVGLSASMWSEIRAPRPSHRVTCGSKFPLPMKTLLLHRCTVPKNDHFANSAARWICARSKPGTVPASFDAECCIAPGHRATEYAITSRKTGLIACAIDPPT